RLISDLFCDGLGACIGHCPQGAITIEEREAEPYDEKKVMENIVKQGKNVIKAHLEHLKEHNQTQYLKEALEYLKESNIDIPLEDRYFDKNQFHSGSGGCPGLKIMDLKEKGVYSKDKAKQKQDSQLRNWPIQIMLMPTFAPYLENAELLVAADCTAFSFADFHAEILKDKVLLIGCPKLDDVELYKEKFVQILKNNNIKSITCVHMEVPCCFGLVHILKEAIRLSKKELPFKEITIGIKGDIK
ncbi:MAG: 4Fe-4S ferredoxin, partial [Candidatus Omnitrophica bacterium]|nr:4Fe-4S ferredoxin [Candidatus Omnitrophota bacterium]